MGTLTDLSAIINRLTGGNSGNPQHPAFWFDSRIQAAAAVNTVSGQITSLWRYNKTNGANGATPSAAAVPDRSTLGALGQSNPTGGRQLWLLGLEASITQGGVLMLYDRLLHNGGLSGTVTTAQTVGGTLTRNTGGVGNEIWIEIYSAIGTTATTISASYTNQAGTSGRTTPAVAIGNTNLREESRIIKLPLQDGDTGVQAVASVTLAASTTTAGSFGVTIAKPIAMGLCEAVGAAVFRDFVAGLPSLPEIATDACLAFAWLAASTTAPKGMAQLHMVEA